jgi:hypothetical protein
MTKKLDRSTIRSVKLTARFSENEISVINSLAENLRISRVELFVRSVVYYKKAVEEERKKNQLTMDI